jgi:hypothetical protein
MASTGSNFTAAINALVAERDRVFLVQVAADYNIPYEELQTKYLQTAEVAIKVPRKYVKKPTAVTVVGEDGQAVPVKTTKAPKEPKAPKAPKAKAEKQCCTAQTSKKEPCKFGALKGEVFCKRHLKQSLGEPAEATPKVKVPKVPKAKALEPVHNHVIGAESCADCDLCQTNGNALCPEPADFELVIGNHTGPVKQLTAAERLAAILADSDDESEAAAEEEDELEPEVVAAQESGDDLEEEDYDDEE